MAKYFRRSIVDKIAERHEWELYSFDEFKGHLVYKKDGVVLEVHYRSCGLRSVLNHPKKGVTSLWRSKLTLHDLEAIFYNPRQHTGKGKKDKYIHFDYAQWPDKIKKDEKVLRNKS